jgi:hypothetical protein
LASIGASAAAFLWRTMMRLHTVELAVQQHRRDLEAAQASNEAAMLRLAERLATMHDDYYRLRESLGSLPSRADLHDLEVRLNDRLDSLASRFDRALDPRLS